MSLTPRRTVRIPDDEWNAGHEKAQGDGDNLTSVLRRLLAGYLAGHQIYYQATSKLTVNGVAQVVRGLEGPLEDIERLYRPSHWTIEEYDVSPPRPVKRRTA
ncbi:MAG: hypothetical protein JST91_02945 [Actinobacteria bacterium]|nr:hypothetical protein [Actinomycetota bacterium]